MRNLMIGAAASAVAALALGAAEAAVTYTADASTTLTLVSVANTTNADAGTAEFVFAVSTSLDGEGSETTGDATANTSFLLEPSDDGLGLIQNGLAAGDTVVNAGSVSGAARDGTSSAFVSTAGDMFMQNLSLTDTFEVTFELTYDLFASAVVGALGGESAEAGAFATVESSIIGDVTGTVLQDGVSTALSDLVLDLALQPTGADGALSESGTLLLTFVLAPGAAVNMFMFADVLGNGVGIADMDANPVPLPGALGFMLMGAAGAAGLRRRARG